MRGNYQSWPSSSEAFGSAFVQCLRSHGVTVLLNDRLGEQARELGWPVAVIEELHELSKQHAMAELASRHELRELLGQFQQLGVLPLMLKGAALAYTVYSKPVLRARSDIDLLIPPEQQSIVASMLVSRGFIAANTFPDGMVSTQTTYYKTDAAGVQHAVDLHLQISNSPIFNRCLNYEELVVNIDSIPELGKWARTIDTVNSLLFACMHRAGHLVYKLPEDMGREGDRLIWLYDIHLLVSQLGLEQWQQFVGLAHDKQLCGICLDAMLAARDRFGTALPPDMLTGLANLQDEPSAIYLSGNPIRVARKEFSALPGIPAKTRYLVENLLPPVNYMRAKYGLMSGVGSDWKLPYYYIYRVMHGVRRRLRMKQDKTT